MLLVCLGALAAISQMVRWVQIITHNNIEFSTTWFVWNFIVSAIFKIHQ